MSEIIIYQSDTNEIEVNVQLQDDTVWLNREQLAQLFGRDVKTIGKHVNNVFNEGELKKAATVANFATVQKEGEREVKRNVEHYNLDVIISVGYRVKSKQGTQFRIWANKVLKEYLIKGFALNQKKLETSERQLLNLKQSLSVLEQIIQRKELNADEATGLLKVIAEYAHALDLLDQYDHQKLQLPEAKEQETVQLTYEEAIEQIGLWRDKYEAGGLFGNEKDKSFHSSLQTIYQTFDGNELYPGIEEKAANLLYFVVKNHSFTDGNKRIAAGLFAYFLDKNQILYDQIGQKIIADNTLVAITIMIAESRSDDKEIMIKLIVNLMTAQ